MLMTLCACGGKGAKTEPETTPAPALNTAPVQTPEPERPPAETEALAGRREGERFEKTILIEGMEETVRYEHIRSEKLGFEMDYDYERFDRRSEPDRERFISTWDDPAQPVNYLEVTYSPDAADAIAASVREALSQEYDLLEGSRELDRAGACIRIEASERKGTGTMADLLQAVYIIPAGEGSLVATAHYGFESADGFGRRFSDILNTLSVC